MNKLTVRLQYLCWCIKFWMDTHIPYWPIWLRIRLLKPFAPERWNIDPKTYEFWREHNPNFANAPKPLPWLIGVAALGPFAAPWNRVSRWFGRRTGGRSHRCEFTDSERGALHGGQDGGFMDEYFEQFLKNISTDDQI